MSETKVPVKVINDIAELWNTKVLTFGRTVYRDIMIRTFANKVSDVHKKIRLVFLGFVVLRCMTCEHLKKNATKKNESFKVFVLLIAFSKQAFGQTIFYYF